MIKCSNLNAEKISEKPNMWNNSKCHGILVNGSFQRQWLYESTSEAIIIDNVDKIAKQKFSLYLEIYKEINSF